MPTPEDTFCTWLLDGFSFFVRKDEANAASPANTAAIESYAGAATAQASAAKKAAKKIQRATDNIRALQVISLNELCGRSKRLENSNAVVKNGCFYIFGSLGCVVKRDEESMSVIAA
jgi:hypothetical protein